MNKPFKPLLAKAVEFELLDYSNLWLSPKLDGIRAIVRDGVVMSRSLKPIPNKYVQETYGRPDLEGFDGELICGEANDDPYSRTYSGVMSEDGVPDVIFHVFDHIGCPPDEEYFRRLQRIPREFRFGARVPHHPVEDLESILDLEQRYLTAGYEGIMLRAFQGPRSYYKYGRSTSKEGTLLKLKRFTDFEARIVGIEEEMFNGNEATIDALGRTKRSSHAENKTGKGTMGRMLCEDLGTGIDFNCGIFKGFDAAWKQNVWNDPSKVVGKIGKFQKFGPGEKDRPRHPKFLGLRSLLDMS